MIQINLDNRIIQLKYAEHMLHHMNLESVLTNGLLSHNEAEKRGLITEDISMSEVQARRHNKTLNISGLNLGLHDFVSFYFNARNPMLYKLQKIQSKLVIILISIDIIKNSPSDNQYAIFSNGNAGSTSTKFFSSTANLKNIDFKQLFSGSWNCEDELEKSENKRKMCSEVLVYPSVAVSEIKRIICPNQTMFDYVTNLKAKYTPSASHIIVEVNARYFF